MTDKTLMFGVGATKAGTSWLHRYIARHPECHMTSIKELHYFTSLESERALERQIKVTTRRLTMLEAQQREATNSGHAWIARQADDTRRWLAVLERGEAGVADYVEFLRAGAADARLVGEVTPAYALLPEERLKQMAGLSSRVRFVYLLRDPVDRLWSHIRMVAERTLEPGADPTVKAEQEFDRFLAGNEPTIARRSDYAGALSRMRAALRPESLFVDFYEQFFTEATLRRLCDFLGLTYVPGEFDTRVHAGPQLTLDEEKRREAQRLLAPQYAYVADMFGALPARWQDNFSGV